MIIDRQTKFAEIKDKNDIIEALKEVMKVKNLTFDFNDNDSMEEIAQKLNIDIKDLLLIANKKNGSEEEFYKSYPEMNTQKQNLEPSWLNKYDKIDLDVRPSLSSGVDPFALIMQTVAKLDGKILHIINSFETTPLYSVLGKQGFEHYAKEENGVWHIYFYKKS